MRMLSLSLVLLLLVQASFIPWPREIGQDVWALLLLVYVIGFAAYLASVIRLFFSQQRKPSDKSPQLWRYRLPFLLLATVAVFSGWIGLTAMTWEYISG